MAEYSGAVKRRRIDDSDEETEITDIFDELFGGEDSDEEFEGFDIPDDDEQEMDDIDDDDWEVGSPQSPPPILEFEDSLSGIRTKELPQDPVFLDYHKLFMTDNVYTTITTETNR